jgi:formamidopyrimidine-DNA glycosylase
VVASPNHFAYAGGMPERPDITIYVETLAARIVGQPIEHIRLVSPFLLRTAVPPIRSVEGKCVRRVSRLGKRIVLELDDDELFLILPLMIAGQTG